MEGRGAALSERPLPGLCGAERTGRAGGCVQGPRARRAAMDWLPQRLQLAAPGLSRHWTLAVLLVEPGCAHALYARHVVFTEMTVIPPAAYHGHTRMAKPEDGGSRRWRAQKMRGSAEPLRRGTNDGKEKKEQSRFSTIEEERNSKRGKRERKRGAAEVDTVLVLSSKKGRDRNDYGLCSPASNSANTPVSGVEML
ncbi:uncharacterized protein LOC144753216 [Lissotriton helveticus]